MKRLKPLIIDTQKLTASKMTFQINLNNRFEALKEIDAGTFCEIMTSEAKVLTTERDKQSEMETEEDISIRKLD